MERTGFFPSAMKTLLKYSSLLLAVLLLQACRNDDRYIFSANRIAGLEGQMPVREVRSRFAFANARISKENRTGIVNQHIWKINDPQSGEPLLILIFEPAKDTLLAAVEILSPRFHSETGAGLSTPAKLWRKKHRLSKAETTLNHVVAFVEDLNATLEFNKNDLKKNAHTSAGRSLDPGQIREDATPERLILFMK